MTFQGQVQDGVIVLTGGVKLPEGLSVNVTPFPTPPLDPVFKLGELAVSTGIPDLAANIDHYLYGSPKA